MQAVLTLETLLHDEERYQETVHNVPSMQEVNHLITRRKEELELFDWMDEEIEVSIDEIENKSRHQAMQIIHHLTL